MKANQSKNMHLMAFDPVYPKDLTVVLRRKAEEQKQVGIVPKEFGPARYMRMVHYAGDDELFETVDGVIYNDDGTATLEYYAPDAKKVQARYRLHNYRNSSPEYRKDPAFYRNDYVVED
ncbi:MAG: hypothetical protein IJL94_03065, partial [Erysipelotrichaceae bacterium]|nr:hypothetical protein [Erysipelotrichaceae bacterium]